MGDMYNVPVLHFSIIDSHEKDGMINHCRPSFTWVIHLHHPPNAVPLLSNAFFICHLYAFHYLSAPSWHTSNSLGGMLVNSFDKLKSPSSSEETKAANQREGRRALARFSNDKASLSANFAFANCSQLLLNEPQPQNDSFHWNLWCKPETIAHSNVSSSRMQR